MNKWALAVGFVLGMAGCSHVRGVEVWNHPAAEAAYAEWLRTGMPGCGVLPPMYHVALEELQRQCGNYEASGCHIEGRIFVRVGLPNEDAVVAHEYLHYLLHCTGMDSDGEHTRRDVWCDVVGDCNRACIQGRVLLNNGWCG